MLKLLKPKRVLYISLALFLLFTFQVLFQTGLSWTINFDDANDYGTAIGGLFSFISVLLIYATLEQQSKAFNDTQFENRFFEMIRYHRDNVAALHMRVPDTISERYFDGHKVAREIHKQVLKVMEIASCYIKDDDLDNLYLNAQTKKVDTDTLGIKDAKTLLELNKINISYLCVFFGASDEGLHSLRQIFEAKYQPTIYNPILDKLEDKIAEWSTNGKGVKFYGGHQYRLGHLFRHLYQAVNYVDNNNELTYAQKYEYIKTLRAQLSTYEQSLLFFNSLSSLGRAWELKVELPNGSKKLNYKQQQDYLSQKKLITKYNMVRNIPNEFINNISVKQFYPDIVFEGENPTQNRARLNETFNIGYKIN